MAGSSAARAVPSLSRQRVALAATALVDEGGFDQLTLRRLAGRLGVSAPSLYEHVSSKNDLVDLVVASVLVDASARWHPPAEWDELIRYLARWWHQVMSEHISVYTSILRRPMAAPVALDTVERVIEALTGVGFTTSEAVAAHTQLFGYVVGASALVHTRADARAAAGVSENDAHRQVEDLLSSLDPDRYPALVEARAPLARLASEQAFEAGLDALIAGLRCQVEQHAERSTRARGRG